MADRLGRIDEAFAMQGEEAAPAVIGFAPVERRAPALSLDRGPAFGQPKLRTGVASVFDEGQVFAAGRQAAGQHEGLEPDPVAGPLVVEGEALAVMADLDKAAL